MATTSSRKRATATVAESVQSVPDFTRVLTQQMIDAQRNHWQAVLAWQGALAVINQELWDQWVSRFAGGAPIGD